MKLLSTRVLSQLAIAAGVAMFVATPANAASCNSRNNCWHGWGNSFHLDGARYPGGNPRGPAFAYNNWEGGFHAAAFWVLSDRGRY